MKNGKFLRFNNKISKKFKENREVCVIIKFNLFWLL